MINNRARTAEARGVAVAIAYERQLRGAHVIDTSNGDRYGSERIGDAIAAQGRVRPPTVSCDLLSTTTAEVRLIEVKSRGSRGDITVIERELDTLAAAARAGWLYVVWNVTQPWPVRLLTIQNPARLDWRITRTAERQPGDFRGARHEAQLTVTLEQVTEVATEVDVTGLLPDSWMGSERD